MKYFILFVKKTLRFLLKPLSFIPAIVLMYIIFNFSAMEGTESSYLSFRVARKAVVVAEDVLQKDWSEELIDQRAERIHYLIRKTAHVTEYFCLAVAVALPLYVYKIRGIWLFLAAGIYCLCFAGLDEYHQYFVAGREGSVRDVWIDAIGIFPGIILVQIFGYIGRKTIFAPLVLPEKKKRAVAR